MHEPSQFAQSPRHGTARFRRGSVEHRQQQKRARLCRGQGQPLGVACNGDAAIERKHPLAALPLEPRGGGGIQQLGEAVPAPLSRRRSPRETLNAEAAPSTGSGPGTGLGGEGN
jgi:hypothetical protein